MAEGTLAVHERRADRQGRRPEGLDGAGQPDRGATGPTAEDAGVGRWGGEASTWWRATRAMVMGTTAWSGSGPDWLRLGVRTCCSATCAGWRGELAALRERAFGAAAKCLAAAAEASAAKGAVDLAALAKRHGVEPAILAAWLDYLGIGTGGAGGQDRHAAAGQDRECVGL